MNRRGGFSLFTLFIMFMFLDSFVSMAFGLVELFFPLAIFGFITYAFYRLFQSLFNQPNTSYSNFISNRQTGTVKSSNYSKIDKVLSQYYKKNVYLILFDDISISTQNGVYTTVDNLYVNYKEEKICQLKELKKHYPAAYDKIINALAELAKKGGKVKETKKSEKKETVSSTNKSLTIAERFIDDINKLNVNLYNEEITNGLYQTCDLLKQIDIVDRQDGEVDPKLNKLYEYYLPMLVDILTNYKTLSESPVKNDEFKKTEKQLISTVKLINEALKAIYNSLHESDYMNLNADISTLQSLLKQDGLVDAFKGEE